MEPTTTPTPRRARRAGAVLAGLGLLALGLAIGFFVFGGGSDPRRESPPASATSVEGEDMLVPEGERAEDVHDDDAGGGRALRLPRESTASIRVDTVAAPNVVIRARGDQCNGAPQAVVTVDGRRVLAAEVSSPEWRTYSARADVAAGSHEVRVSFPNNLVADGCDRNLYVDWVMFTNAPPPAAAAPPAQSTAAPGVIWRGDFEPGNLSQWGTAQRVADDRIRVVGEPVRQGKRAARFEVREGDNVGDGAPRAELALLGRRDACCREGDERWYRWQTMFAQDFPTDPDRFIDFVQFKKDGEGGGPVTFMVWGEELQLRADDIHWRAPLRRGQWQEFIFHAKWSPDPTVGFIELWHDGRPVLPRKYMPTLDRDEDGDAIEAYIKQGLYRADEFTETGVLFHDGMVAGTTLESVRDAG